MTITNTYDRASRAKTRTYSGEPVGQTTPPVSFYYDGKGLASQQSPNFAKGKLTRVVSSVSETQYALFDNFGRLKESRQITDGNTYTSKYTYNLSGALVEEEYPSGRKVKNEFESDGDLLTVTSKKGGSSVYTPYASNFSYTASGGISQMKLGNGRWETAKFNTRLQVTELGLGNSAADASLWKVNYEYGELNADGTVNTAKNTGNIAKQTLSFSGLANPFVQAYKYDSLYRLTEAKETGNGTQNWIQNFGYDRYGNRTSFNQTIVNQQTTTTPTVDANTNRFTLNQGFFYDKNGNVVQDVAPNNQARTFTFNGDNKQTEVKDANGVTIGRYVYDGEGKRVKKVTDTETTVFVYSAGKLIAEYSTQLATQPSTNYTTTDHLGSPRIITDELGQVKARRDFMPFGEELFVNIGQRSESLKYGTNADDIRQKFTGYQKDSETGLDFAEARMYENRYGRFTAVDPLLASGKSANPQTFNRYIYVGNNPIIVTDPQGLDWYFDEKRRYRWSADNKVFDDGSSVDGWSQIQLNEQGEYYYSDGCVNEDCSLTDGVFLQDGGNWEWSTGFLRTMRNEIQNSMNFVSSEFRNGFPNLQKDLQFISEDPLGERGLGNPGLAFVTGGLSTGLRGFSKTATTTTSLFENSSAITKGVGSSTAIQFELYSLRAAESGFYPVMKRGFKDPVGEIFLNKGDVWKYGQTMNPTTRYSQKFLTNTGNGLEFFREFKTTSYKDVLQTETHKIINFRTNFGFLPPGNKIVR